MQRIEFDIKYRADIEAGRYKVETRDGRSVSKIIWHTTGDRRYPIEAKYENEDGSPSSCFYRENGRISGLFKTNYDLLIVPVEQDACTITGWVARDEWKEELWFYKNKPERGICVWYGMKDAHGLLLDTQAFSSLTWADEPVEVELTIKRKEESK